MRISDWSSDVCSSDLADHVWPARGIVAPCQSDLEPAGLLGNRGRPVGEVAGERLKAGPGQQVDVLRHPARPAALVDHLHEAHQPLVAILRSEEHTSELQSLMRISYAVFCLKKTKQTTTTVNVEDTQT